MILAAPFLAAVLPVVAPATPGARGPRYVRLRLAVVAYGVPGTGEILLDRATGRFVRRFDTGPTSEREGWDGTRAWRADATGMARIEGNLDQRDAIRAWSFAFARAPRRIALARPLDVVVDPASGLVTRIVRYAGADVDTTVLADQRTVEGLVLPFALTDTSDDGVWTATVRSVETPARLADAAFAPPAPPHDFTLRARTRVALEPNVDYPIVLVRVDDGPPMRFLLDTGGQNVVTAEAARRIGLRVVGAGTVSGAGPGLAAIRYAHARRVRIGAVTLRDQPFVVVDLGGLFPFDGVVGYELLARCAARLDLAHRQVEFAPSAADFGAAGTSVPFILDDRQPQIAGALDGTPAALTVDTGDSGSVEINAWYMRAHDLQQRYRAVLVRGAYGGIGGMVDAYLAAARVLRIGPIAVRDVPLMLTAVARSGTEADPSVAGNVGDRVWRRFVVVFDYRAGRLSLAPLP